MINYCPISILPVLYKSFETALYECLSQNLEKFILLIEDQYGFCVGKSTSDANLGHFDFVYRNLDNSGI